MTPKDPTNDRLPGEKEERIICPFCGDGLVYKDSLAANTQVWIMELQATISALTQRNKHLERQAKELVEAVKKARVRLEICLGRARGCDEENLSTRHGVSEIEIPGWLEELDALLSQTLATPETKENPK